MSTLHPNPQTEIEAAQGLDVCDNPTEWDMAKFTADSKLRADLFDREIYWMVVQREYVNRGGKYLHLDFGPEKGLKVKNAPATMNAVQLHPQTELEAAQGLNICAYPGKWKSAKQRASDQIAQQPDTELTPYWPLVQVYFFALGGDYLHPDFRAAHRHAIETEERAAQALRDGTAKLEEAGLGPGPIDGDSNKWLDWLADVVEAARALYYPKDPGNLNTEDNAEDLKSMYEMDWTPKMAAYELLCTND